jgi:hypothetical protein
MIRTNVAVLATDGRCSNRVRQARPHAFAAHTSESTHRGSPRAVSLTESDANGRYVRQPARCAPGELRMSWPDWTRQSVARVIAFLMAESAPKRTAGPSRAPT